MKGVESFATIKQILKILSFGYWQTMMTVKRWSRGTGASPIGKPAVHLATVDMKGKAYQYVFIDHFLIY